MFAILSSPVILPIILLALSNLFMTAAWYGHLKYPHLGMMAAIGISWLIAGLEYCLAVPANRIGVKAYDVAQLKTIQEVITLIVFVGFAVLVLGQKLSWHHAVGFGLIAVGASFVFHAPKV